MHCVRPRGLTGASTCNASTTAYDLAIPWIAAIGFIELRDLASAAANFNRSFANQQPPFDVWTETPTGGTANFITGAGGFLQGVVYGYPYLRLNDTSMVFNASVLIEGTSSHRLRGLSYLGNRINYEYNATHVVISLQPLSQAPPVMQEGAYERTHAYAHVCSYASAASARGHDEANETSQDCVAAMHALRDAEAREWRGVSLRPRTSLAQRSQHGKVVVNGRQVAVQPLTVVAEDGAAYPLNANASVTLPIQVVTVQAA